MDKKKLIITVIAVTGLIIAAVVILHSKKAPEIIVEEPAAAPAAVNAQPSNMTALAENRTPAQIAPSSKPSDIVKAAPAAAQIKGEAANLLAQARDYSAKGDIVNARDTYKKIISSYPNSNFTGDMQKELWDENIKIIFSNVKTPDTLTYQVEPGDSLWKIAKKYGTTVELIKRSNNISDRKLRVGVKLRIITGKFSVMVSKSQNTLTLKKGEDIVKIYKVATGENNSSPAGVFKIVSKLENPTWYKSNAIVPPGSPDNILGTRWLGIDKPGYGIHGTTDPSSIGKQATAGCVRMINNEVEELYAILPVGTEVTITD